MALDPSLVEEVRVLLHGAKNISILIHPNLDANTLGIGLGIYNILKKDKTKRVEIVNTSTQLPKHLDFLSSFTKIKHKMDFEDSLIITCDAGSIDRFGFDLTDRKVLNIYHHKSNQQYEKNDVVVAYELFKALYTIETSVATCFYAALLSNTQYFTASSVDKVVFEVAKELVDLGVDPAEVSFHFTQRRSLSGLRTLEKALHSLTLYDEAQIAVTFITQDDILETGATMPDMEGIVEYARSLVTVEIGILLVELEDGIRVSLRSKSTDVSKLALIFDGDGHRKTTEFTVRQTTLHETIDTILKKIKELGLLNGKS